MQNLLKVEVEGLSRLRIEDIYRISDLYPSLYFESDDDCDYKTEDYCEGFADGYSEGYEDGWDDCTEYFESDDCDW